MLLELRRPGDALVEYRAALLKKPNRYRTLHGGRRAAFASGYRAAAVSYAAQARKMTGCWKIVRDISNFDRPPPSIEVSLT